MINTALLIIFVCLGIYGWLCGVGCGVAMLRLLPSSSLIRQALRLFSPAWELVNLVLLLGAAAFILLFGNNIDGLQHAVQPGLVLGMALLMVRVLLVVYMSLTHKRTGLTGWNLLFGGLSFAVPLCFGAVGSRLLIGQVFWLSPTGWATMVVLLLGLLALGVGFVYFVVGQTPHDRLRQVSRLATIALVLVVVAWLGVTVAHFTPHVLSLPFTYFEYASIFLLVCQLGLGLIARERYMWWLLSAYAVAAPVLLSLANRPYLDFPQVTLDAAQTGAHAAAEVVGLAIALPVVLLVLGLIAWRLTSARPQPSVR